MSAWEAAGKRCKTRKERDATTTAYNQPTALEQQEYFLVIQAFEEAHHPLKDHQTPAQEYAETKLKEAEVGNINACQLSQVITQDEADGEQWGSLRVAPTGALVASRSRSSDVHMPADSEGYRTRMKVLVATL